MFRHLRVKLTFLYTGLFCLVLLMIGATAYFAISGNTQRMASEQLTSTSAVFDQLWTLRLNHLRDSAATGAANPVMQQAAGERNEVLTRALLANLRARAGADVAFFVTREGLVIGDGTVNATSVPPGLQIALERAPNPHGSLTLGDRLYQAATAVIPGDLGWIVVGAELDRDQLDALGPLSGVPITANVLLHREVWRAPGAAESSALDSFIDDALAMQRPRALRDPAGEALTLAHALPSLDGARAVLLLQYPLSSAISPYGGLFSTLLVISAIGIGMLVAGTWFLARSITQPLSTLEEAARKLQQGVYDAVVVPTKDELSRLAGSFNSMISAIQDREKRITQLAYHDAETRLPNRLALERRLSSVTNADRVYLAAVGVDRFSHVRGAIGYALAGAMMRSLGARLAHLVGNAPMARLSSDTLGVSFLASDEADARKRASALVANLEQPLSLDGQELDVTVTVGLAQPRSKGETPAEMIERASVALDQARTARQKVGVYDDAAYGDPARNLSLMGEMRRAMETGELFLTHQPKYNFRTGRIDSAECLVRWKHPTRGLISPDLFVPMAEETGHVRALTEWVLQRAVADQRELSRAGWPLALSVNISGRLLSDTDFARSAVQLVKPAPHTICFEITETAVVDNPKLALENIELFAQNGIRIAIDDYGSGLSSLAYLKQLPAHELKIDKMFVQSVTTNRRDALLVRSTIDLAHGLGMEVTAEGVETPAAFALLSAMRCDLAQGYLVARPGTVDELIAILGDERRLRFYQQTAASGATGPQEIETRPKTA